MKTRSSVWAKAKVPARDLAASLIFPKQLWELISSNLPQEPTMALDIYSRRGAFASALLGKTKKTRVFSIDVWDGRGGQGNLLSYMKRVIDELWIRAIPLPGGLRYWMRVFPYQVDLLYVEPPKGIPAETTLERCLDLVQPRGLILVAGLGRDEVAAACARLLPRFSTAAVGPGGSQVAWKVT